MQRKIVRTTLEEDFKELGIPYGEDAPIDDGSAETQVKDLGSSSEDEETTGEDTSVDMEESTEDPLTSEYVNVELFDRIEALPHDSLMAEDYEDLLSELAKKKLPDGDEEIREHAERVVRMLQEGAAKRIRRFKKMSTVRKLSFKCPEGKRAMGGGDGGRPICRPSHQVVGGVGKLNKESRKKKKWSRTGSGKVSFRRSERASGRRQHFREDGVMSPLAQELLQVTESVSSDEEFSVRDEIIERIVNIFELLNEEFMDKSVAGIFNDTVESLLDAYEHDRLEEDAMDDSEFIAELDPNLKLITKSLGMLEDMEDSGNE